MEIDKLLELTKENYYIHKTTYLAKIKEPSFRKKLVQFYNHELEEMRIMGSVLNSIYTEGKTTFYFSKRSLKTLIENDRKNLEAKGRNKISLGKQDYKVNHFRQKLIEMFKGNGGFNLMKEASVKMKTPSVIEMVDEDMYKLMDEHGELTKKNKSSQKKSAMDSILKIEEEMTLENADQFEDTNIDLEVDLSMDDDWIFEHMKSFPEAQV